MPDLAQRDAVASKLPFTTEAGDTVSISNGVIYVNARPRSRTQALDLSIALVCAVSETDHTNHTTNREEASHG